MAACQANNFSLTFLRAPRLSIYCSSSGGAFPQCLLLNGWPSVRLRQGTEPASDARSLTTAPHLHHRGHHVLQPNPSLSALSFVPWHFSHTVCSCVTSFLLFFFSSSYILIRSLYFCPFLFFFHQHRSLNRLNMHCSSDCSSFACFLLGNRGFHHFSRCL